MASTSSRANAQANSYQFRLHSIVQVVDAIDVDIHNVTPFVGRIGEVLNVGAPDGDTTFADALLVGFCDGSSELFWPEELALP